MSDSRRYFLLSATLFSCCVSFPLAVIHTNRRKATLHHLSGTCENDAAIFTIQRSLSYISRLKVHYLLFLTELYIYVYVVAVCEGVTGMHFTHLIEFVTVIKYLSSSGGKLARRRLSEEGNEDIWDVSLSFFAEQTHRKDYQRVVPVMQLMPRAAVTQSRGHERDGDRKRDREKERERRLTQ